MQAPTEGLRPPENKYTPAQSPDCPAFGRKPPRLAVLAWPQGMLPLDHTKANPLNARRSI